MRINFYAVAGYAYRQVRERIMNLIAGLWHATIIF